MELLLSSVIFLLHQRFYRSDFKSKTNKNIVKRVELSLIKLELSCDVVIPLLVEKDITSNQLESVNYLFHSSNYS